MKPIRQLLLASLLSVVMAGQAHAQASVPSLLNYQGYLEEGGTPVAAGVTTNRKVYFRFWNHASNSAAPNLLYSEEQTVTINSGDFSVLLGQGTPIATDTALHTNIADAFGGAEVFLGITVDNGDGNLNNDSEVSPRQRLVSTAYAFRSKVASTVDAGAISNVMLAAGAVQAGNLDAGAVTSAALANGGVTGAKIASATITAAHLAANSVTAAAIGPGEVGTSEIADSSIATGDLANNAVTNAKLSDNAVSTAKLTDNAVTNVKLGNDSVTTLKLANGSVTTAKMADNAVTSAVILDGTVTTSDLSFETITSPDALRIVRGHIRSDGTKKNGIGFTVVRNPSGGNGSYDITFSPAFTGDPTIVATCVNVGDNARTAIVDLKNDNGRAGFWLHVNNDANQGRDTDVQFIAIGPR